MSASEQPIPAKPRLSWRGVSMLMVSDIVGTSVLTFPAVAAELGYALTVLLIVGLFPVTVYVSVLMARTHVRVRGIDSLGSAARRIFGPRYAGGTFAVVAVNHASFAIPLSIRVDLAPPGAETPRWVGVNMTMEGRSVVVQQLL